MSALTQLSLTDVRCFAGTHQAELPRITVLVGENSAGKSTFLGCLQGLAHVANLQKWDRERSTWDDLDDENHFARPPFWMDSFAAMARSGSATFSLEATLRDHHYDRIRVTYDRGANGEPRERELELRFATDGEDGPAFKVIRVDRSSSEDDETWRVVGPGFEFDFAQSSVSYAQPSTWLSRSVMRGHLPYDGNLTLRRKQTGDPTPESDRMFAGFVNFFRRNVPLRTPERALVIANNDPDGWERRPAYGSNPFGRNVDAHTLEEIRELGRKLGIFSDLEVRRGALGHYEVWANASGEPYNLVHVGFGIQSALPLLQAIASAPEEATILLQQPEAHLHPRAQAALVRSIASRGGRVLVESHSDHVPDWFRIAVMSGEVDPDDLGIVYFERADDRMSTELHGIRVDRQANLGDAPPGFRHFFLDETERLLGFRR